MSLFSARTHEATAIGSYFAASYRASECRAMAAGHSADSFSWREREKAFFHT